MRFDDLFRDLEGQLEAELGAEDRDVRAEEERFRIGRLEVRDRLARATSPLDLHLVGGDRLCMTREQIGRDWLSGTVLEGAQAGAEAIVPMHAIRSFRLTQDALAASLEARDVDALVSRLTFGFVLRDLARRRVPVELHCPDSMHGTLDRVGRDHADLAVHEAGTWRRDSAVQGIDVVPFTTIAWLRVVAV